MESFKQNLIQIHEKLIVREEFRRPYKNLLNCFLNWFTSSMCQIDEDFKYLYKDYEVCEQHPIRPLPMMPHEYDVYLLFQFPIKLKLTTNSVFPGFVKIKSKKKWQRYKNPVLYAFEHMFNVDRLQRNRLQSWIEYIIERLIDEVGFPLEDCTITLNRRDVAINISIIKGNITQLSVDLIPAILLNKSDAESVVQRRQKSFRNPVYIETFAAIPKTVAERGTPSSRPYTFQLINIIAEKDAIWRNQSASVLFPIMRSLCDTPNMPRFKTYFLTSIFLFEIITKRNKLRNFPLQDNFFHMLNVLVRCFQNNILQFYWSPQYNLLKTLKPEEVQEYSKYLKSVQCALKDISVRRSLQNQLATYFNTAYGPRNYKK